MGDGGWAFANDASPRQTRSGNIRISKQWRSLLVASLLPLPEATSITSTSSSNEYKNLGFAGGELRGVKAGRKGRLVRECVRVRDLADPGLQKMNLNEYMVTLGKPMGIRFALSVDGRIFVHSLKKGDPTVVKVIERSLTEDERFLPAFAARRMAFAICPIKLTPK